MSGRVLFLYYSSHTVCGVGTWLEILVPELERRGWDVITGLAWGRQFHDPRRVEQCRPGLKTVWMDGRTGTEEGRIQAIERTVRKVKPDIVIVSCLDSAFEAVRRLRLDGVKFRFIATNHGNFAHQAAFLLNQKAVIDMAVCMGKMSMEPMAVAPEGFPGERIRHIPYAVTSPANPQPRTKANLRVGFAARLDEEERKRVRDIPLFFSELRKRQDHFQFWIAGGGTLESPVRQLAEDYPDYVKYFGPLTKQQLYTSFFPALDIFVNFSSSEAFGLSIAEAMAHGAVTVTSAFTGIQEQGLVKDRETGLLFPVGELAAAADHVVALWKDSERLLSLSTNSIQHIKTTFSPDSCGEQWHQTLQECMSLSDLPIPSAADSLLKAGRFGIKEIHLEKIRRLLRRYFPHASAGEEWPHYRCKDMALMQLMAKRMGISPDLVVPKK